MNFKLLEVNGNSEFLNLLRCVQSSAPIVTLSFTDWDISIKTMDQDSETLINLNVPVSVLDYYAYWLGELRINLTDFFRVLKVKKDDWIKFNYDPENYRIELIIQNSKRTVKKVMYALEPEKEKVIIPKTEYLTKTRVLAKTIKKDVNILKKISDNVKVRTDISAFELSANDEFLEESCFIAFTKNDENLISHNTVYPYKIIEGNYLNEYLTNVLKKINKISETIVIESSINGSLKISPDIDKGELNFYLKPLTGE